MMKLGKYILHLGLRKNSFENAEQHTYEAQMKIEENFYLPLFVGKKQILEYEFETLEYTEEEMDTLLTERFQQFCADLEEQNVVILENNLLITHDKTGAKAKSLLMLQEEAGVQRKIVDF